MNRWKLVAIVTFAAGLLQGCLVVDRIQHALTLHWKIGPDYPLLTAGTSTLVTFGVFTSVFLFAATVAARRLRRAGSLFWSLAGAGGVLLGCGAIIWIGMIASPIAAVVHR